MSGLSDTSAFDAFNRMAEKIEEEERRSVAQAEVNEALAGDTLEDEFLRLESGGDDSGVEDKLLQLKAQMGLLPGGAPEAPKQLEAPDGPDSEAAAVDEGEGEEGDHDAAEPPPIREAELLEEFEKLESDGGDGLQR